MPGLRGAQSSRKLDVELPNGSTVKDLLAKMGFGEGEVQHLRVFVDEKLVTLSKILKGGEDIWVGIIIGGG